MAMNQARVITVTSVKGGTGKTTTVLSLAGIYSLKKKKTLIIDLDLYSSAICTMLNITSNDDLYRLVDDLNNNRYEHFDDYLIKYNDYIDIIQAPKDPRLSSKIDTKYLSIIFSKAILKYDVILIDTNHFLNSTNLVAFDNSNVILYVLTNDAMDLKNMKTMVSIFKDMNMNNYRVLLNSSIFKGRKKYSNYDIKNFIKHDIDFHIRDSFYLKDIDNYVMEGKILTLDKRIRSSNKKTIKDIETMADSLLIDEKGE